MEKRKRLFMKITALIPSGDPIDLNYQTFYAAIQSWSKIVDEIKIADSGITSKSLNLIPELIRDKLNLISNEVTKWNVSENYSFNQINDMVNISLMDCDADWVIFVPADHVLSTYNREYLEKELLDYSDEYWIRVLRYKIKIYGKEKNKT